MQTNIPNEKGKANIQKGRIIRGLSRSFAVNLNFTQAAYSNIVFNAFRKLSMTRMDLKSNAIRTTINIIDKQMA